jgi:hypothetical protein
MSDQEYSDKGHARLMYGTYRYKEAIGEDAKTWFKDYYTSLTSKIGRNRAEQIRAYMTLLKNENPTQQPTTSAPGVHGNVAEG